MVIIRIYYPFYDKCKIMEGLFIVAREAEYTKDKFREDTEVQTYKKVYWFRVSESGTMTITFS